MTLQEIEAALAATNATVDELKASARELARKRDRAIAEAKIAAMPEAEREALLAVLKG